MELPLFYLYAECMGFSYIIITIINGINDFKKYFFGIYMIDLFICILEVDGMMKRYLISKINSEKE